jgi:hypothetical protein
MRMRSLIVGASRFLREASRTPRARALLAIAQYAVLAGVAVYLTVKLSHIGWSEIARSLPSSPLFYLIFVLRYFALPVSEVASYGVVWRRPMGRHFAAFVRKRVYNFAVLGYSGEAFFTLWARRRLNLSDAEILRGVKDNNLVSAFASNIATALLIGALFFSGRLGEAATAMQGAMLLFVYAFASSTGFAVAALAFRRRLLSHPPRALAKVFMVNFTRMALTLALHALLYWTALPEAPVQSWFIFTALQLSLSRVPFAPNLDILFLAAALHFSPLVAAPDAAIAGMLSAEAGLAQIFNLALFAATTHMAGPTRRAAASAPGAGLAVDAGASGR